MARYAWPMVVVLSFGVSAAIAEEPAPTELVVTFAVSPQAAPRPALRYLLLPSLKERQPGNSVPAFYKCMFEQNYFYYNPEQEKLRNKWQTVPLAEVPGEELRNYGGAGLRQADYAARLDTVDWQLTSKVKTDGVGLLLPDVQVLRHVASALKVRFRGEVKRGDMEAALVTAKTMFSMSRMFSEHPTLIGNLVGIAISQLAVSPLEEMIGQPGCPNLFWALTQLPSPLVSIQSGFEGERTFILAEFGGMLDDTGPMSEAQLQKCLEVFRRLASLMDTTEKPSIAGDEWIKKRAADANILKAARDRLAAFGLAADKLQKMPPVQIMVVDEMRQYEVQRDEGLKWATMPFWRMPAKLQSEDINRTPPRADEPNNWLSSQWTPAIFKVRRAQLRLEQRLAMLQHVEAIRLYAAEHNGKLPAKLADIEVPLPVDPFTGKPFLFEAKDKKVTLRGTPPPGSEKISAFNVRYEITVRE